MVRRIRLKPFEDAGSGGLAKSRPGGSWYGRQSDGLTCLQVEHRLRLKGQPAGKKTLCLMGIENGTLRDTPRWLKARRLLVGLRLRATCRVSAGTTLAPQGGVTILGWGRGNMGQFIKLEAREDVGGTLDVAVDAGTTDRADVAPPSGFVAMTADNAGLRGIGFIDIVDDGDAGSARFVGEILAHPTM